MKQSYPIVMSKGTSHIVVYVPDFDINTQGEDYTDAIEMSRDAIGVVGIELEDRKEQLPCPTAMSEVRKENDDDIISLVDVDFTEYRRQNDIRAVRRNVTLPSWLDAAAAKSGVNVSAILQRALKQELHLTDR